MRILFAGKQHFDVGGIEASTDQLARRLVQSGHRVGVLARRPLTAAPPALHRRRALEPWRGLGYAAWGVDALPPARAMQKARGLLRPDVVVVNGGGRWWHDWTVPLFRAAAPVPTVLYARDRTALEVLGDGLRPDLVLTNATAHTEEAHRQGHDAATIPSLVEPDVYRTVTTGEVVLLVNPVASKGVDTALGLAEARPDIPFVLLRSWQQPRDELCALRARAARLGNVVIAGPTTDMRRYYSRARLMLAPYDDGGRPRVVAEAQVSGIPVLALDHDALREAVGPGGCLVPRGAPLREWEQALAELWDDPDALRSHSEAALRHSRRPELDPARVTGEFEERLASMLHTGRSAPRAATGSALHRRCVGQTSRPMPPSPLVSVIVPARDVAATLDRQLRALCNQTYQGRWEIVVSDNGSVDDTRARALAWTDELPHLSVVDSSGRQGVAHARNVGIASAKGDVILICDGDDEVVPEWVERMVDAVREHDIVCGRLDLRSVNRPDQYEWTGDADPEDAPIGYRYLPYASGGNIALRREVFDAMAGFDETLRRLEDLDFSWRAHYAGYDVHFAPEAVIGHSLRDGLVTLARGRIRGGSMEPLLYRRHRARGMRRESAAEVLGMYRWLWRRAGQLRTDPELRYRWVAHAAQRVGRVAGSVRHRSLFL